MTRNQRREDLTHEPIREQEIQQPIQGDHRSRLVRLLPPLYLVPGSLTPNHPPA